MRSRAALLLLLLLAAPLLLAQLETGTRATPMPSRDPETETFVRKGCAGCHRFTGMREAVGNLGPDLTKVKTRLGRAEIRAILDDPARANPGTKMPDIDLSRREMDLLVHFMTRGKPTPRPSPRRRR